MRVSSLREIDLDEPAGQQCSTDQGDEDHHILVEEMPRYLSKVMTLSGEAVDRSLDQLICQQEYGAWQRQPEDLDSPQVNDQLEPCGPLHR